METYLSKERITSIANYLNRVLPKENTEVLKGLEEKGIHLEYMSENRVNYDIVWQFLKEEYLKNSSADELAKFERLKDAGQFSPFCQEMITNYINKHYKKAIDIINNTDFSAIQRTLLDMCREAKASTITVHEVLFCKQDYQTYLNEKYGKKSVDTGLLKETERIAKAIDEQYFGKRGNANYFKYKNAIEVYMITGDINLLHNMLNSDTITIY